MKGRKSWYSSFAALPAFWFGRSLRGRGRDDGALQESSIAQPASKSINAFNAKGNGLARLVSNPSLLAAAGAVLLFSVAIFVLFPATIPAPSDQPKEEHSRAMAVPPAPSFAAASQDRQGNDALVTPSGIAPSGLRLSREDEQRKHSVFPVPDSIPAELSPLQEVEWEKDLAFSDPDRLLSGLRPTPEDEWRRYAVFPGPGSATPDSTAKEGNSQSDEGDRTRFGSVAQSGKLEDTKKAAAQGIADAQYALAVYFASPGAEQDFKQAALWCERAAAQGQANAQIAAGQMYERGLPGVPKDLGKAAFWYEKALAQQATERTALLALYSLRAQGEAMDYIEARKWSIVAAARGMDSRTIASIAAMRGKSPGSTSVPVEEKMALEQIAEAERRANAWLTATK